jgi:hypothetical protein
VKPDKRPNLPRGWDWPPTPAMVEDGERCLERLGALGVAFERAPRTPEIATPVVVPAMELGGVRLEPMYPTWRRPPYVMDCHLAVTLADGGGALLARLGVAALRFSSIHELRNVGRSRVLSRHALGLAMDVYEVTGPGGAVHVVARAYRAGDALLHTVERELRAAGLLRGLLTPGNDPRRHRDHFHMEARTLGDPPPVVAGGAAPATP